MRDQIATNLSLILQEKKYFVPVLQRNYEWEVLNIEELWNDLINDDLWNTGSDKIENHFMGTIVTCPHQEDGKNVLHENPRIQLLDILDGQQRLTTISIFLVECLRRMQKLGVQFDYFGNAKSSVFINKGKKDIKELVLNLQPSLDFKIYDYFTTCVNKQVDPDLSLQGLKNRFQSEFKFAKIGKNKLLICINTVRKLLDETIKNEGGKIPESEILDTICDRLLHKTNFLTINTSSAKSAYKIFESLNNRGVDLSQADLIKNKFCSLLDENELEKFSKDWNSIKVDVSAEPNGIVSFLRSYIISKYGHVTKNDLLDKYEIYLGINDKENNKRQIKKNLNNLIEDLLKHSLKFSMLTSPEDTSYEEILDWDLKISFLNDLQAKTCRHALLAALIYDFKDIDKLINVITLLQLRYTISKENPNKPEKAHCTVAKLIGDKNGKVDFSEILEIYSNLIPSNEQFFRDFIELSATSIPVWRHILERFHMRTSGTEMVISDSKKVHVEHILAIKANQESLQESKIENKDELAKYAHKPGNLTLLDHKLNIKAQNGAFSRKKKDFYSISKIPMNRYFDNIDKWTKEEIDKRTYILLQAVSEIWVHPKEGSITPEKLKLLINSIDKNDTDC